MSAAHVHRRINAPIDRVWRAATDVAGAAGRLRGVESIEHLTDGPFRVGTRWRETRLVGGQRSTEEMHVVETTPPRLFVLDVSSGGATARSTTTLTAAGPAATEVEISLETRPPSAVGRVVGVFFGVLAARAVLATLNRDLDDLARWCERQENAGR
jgi:uncharacterized protein YndB with AHSA1/START domain